jgi:hypothetical protein
VQDFGVGAGHGLIGREDETARVGNMVADLGEATVGRREHGRHPLALGVERRAPRLRGDVFRVVLAEVGLELVAGARAPAHLAGVHVEEHGPDHAVGECSPVAVVVVGARDARAGLVGMVLDERDRSGVASEGRSGEQQPALRGPVRVADGVAPAQSVAPVVDLVEDDQRLRVFGQMAMHRGLRRHLRVRHDGTVIVPRRRPVAVAEAWIEPDVHARGSIGPLRLQVLGRCDDDDAVHLAQAHQLDGQGEGEGRLACAGRRRHEEVALIGLEVLVERLLLPGAQLARGAPGGALRKGRREHRLHDNRSVGHRRAPGTGIRGGVGSVTALTPHPAALTREGEPHDGPGFDSEPRRRRRGR